jgi:hypothetical protein
MYICKKKTMVKAYTLSDKIVQMGYNDFETIVGMVFNKPDGDDAKLSSASELASSGATQIPIGQVCTFVNDGLSGYNTFTVITEIFEDTSSSELIVRSFQGWTKAGYDQWIQVRSLSVVNASTTIPGAMIYKLVVDAFTSVAP